MDPALSQELLADLPELARKLEAISTRFLDYGIATVAVNPIQSDPPAPVQVIGPKQMRPVSPSPPDDASCNKKAKIEAKIKPRFSSISGPDIIYDGEAQNCLFDCWTSLNTKRAWIRKELLRLQGTKPWMIASTVYEDIMTDIMGDGVLVADDSEADEEEEERLRLEEERRLAEEQERRKQHEKTVQALNFIGSALEKAIRGCENAAFLWLKGEGCAGHVVFLVAVMNEVLDRVQAELKPKHTRTVEKRDSREFGDEGLGEELATDPCPPEELFHKKAQRTPS